MVLEDGVVSWQFTPSVYRVVFHRRSEHEGRLNYSFNKIRMIVRHPFDTTVSTMFTEDCNVSSFFWRAIFIPLNTKNIGDINESAKSVIYWYCWCLAQINDSIVRLEDLEDNFSNPDIRNTRKHPKMTDSEVIRGLDKSIAKQLIELTEYFGYNPYRS